MVKPKSIPKLMPVRAGFKFECQKCGECCRHDGAILLTGEEITYIRHYDIPLYFRKDIVKDKDGKTLAVFPIMPVVKVNGITQCFCLGDEKHPNYCTIHKFRPQACAFFPFVVHTRYIKPFSPDEIRKMVGDPNLSDEATKEFVHTRTYEYMGKNVVCHHFFVAQTTIPHGNNKPCPGVNKGIALTEDEINDFLKERYLGFIEHTESIKACVSHYTQMFGPEFDTHFELVEGFPDLYRSKKRSWKDIIDSAGKKKNAPKK